VKNVAIVYRSEALYVVHITTALKGRCGANTVIHCALCATNLITKMRRFIKKEMYNVNKPLSHG